MTPISADVRAARLDVLDAEAEREQRPGPKTDLKVQELRKRYEALRQLKVVA